MTQPQTFNFTRETNRSADKSKLVPHHPDCIYHPFFFMHHPSIGGYEFVPVVDNDGKAVVDSDGKIVYEWLPKLSKFILMPGANGVAQGKNASEGALWTDTEARRRAEGWTVLTDLECVTDIEAFGKPSPGGYRWSIEGVRGSFYADVWSMPVVRGAGQFRKTTWRFDPLGFARFRRLLLHRGIVSTPDLDVIEELMVIQEHRARRREADGHIPAVAEHIEKEHHKLLAMNTTVSSGELSTSVGSLPRLGEDENYATPDNEVDDDDENGEE